MFNLSEALQGVLFPDVIGATDQDIFNAVVALSSGGVWLDANVVPPTVDENLMFWVRYKPDDNPVLCGIDSFGWMPVSNSFLFPKIQNSTYIVVKQPV